MKTDKKNKKPLKKRLSDFFHSPSALRLLICVIGITALISIYVLAIVPVRYDLKVGMVPNATITATKDVEDTYNTERNRKTAANAVTPTYRFQEGVTEQVLNKFDEIFAELRMVNQYAQTLPDWKASRVFQREELDYAHSMLKQIKLSDYQLTAVLRATQAEMDEAYTLLFTTIQSTMVNHVTEGQENTARNNIKQIVNYRMSVALGQYMVPPVLTACIQPNMVIDQEATEAARQEARNAVEPVIFKQGQNIVVKGEGRVSQSQLSMLSTLGLLSNSQVDGKMYLGAGLFVVCVIAVMLWMMRLNKEKLDWKKMLILFLAMVLTLAASVAARLVHVYLVPVLLGCFIVSSLLGVKMGIIANAAMTLLVSSLAAGGNQVYGEVMPLILVTGLISGTAVALLLQKKTSRLQLILAGGVACVIGFVLHLAMGLMTAEEISGSLVSSIWYVGGTLVAVLLSIGILPVLESVFNLATPMKLMELSNPNQPLLRKLMLEAPGTYHHSIIVANLAEAAAEAVGANPLLARVGGYYHDIGKLKRPSYFKENQMGEKNAHDDTDPYVSAAIVTAHTMDGVSLGKSYRLPPEILEMISSHHGDTPVMYFYHKAVQLADEPVDMDTFRYDGHPPKSAEAAILLLCDTIEAAVRTLPNPTPEAMEEFIVKLVRGKLEDGQLSDSPLTFRDMDKICAAVTTVLSGVFHERIEYPEVKHSSQQRIIHAVQEEQKAAQMEQPVAEEQMVDASLILPEISADPMPVLDMEQMIVEPLPRKDEMAAQETASEAEEAAETPETEMPEAETEEAVEEATPEMAEETLLQPTEETDENV